METLIALKYSSIITEEKILNLKSLNKEKEIFHTIR